MKKKYSTLILYLLLFVYFELISKILMFNKLPSKTFLIVILFCVPIALLFYLLGNLFTEKKQKVLNFIFVIGITAFYIFHYLFFELLTVPFSLSTLELADQAMDFYEIGFHLFVTKIIDCLLFLIPFFSFLIYHKKMNYTKKTRKQNLVTFFLVILTYFIALCSLNIDKKDLYSAYNLYYKVNSLTTSNNVLGIMTTQRLSLKRNLFGFKEQIVLENLNELEKEEEKYNALDIDFDKLIENESNESIKEAYSYFKNKEATNQNEYTGLFKGKNLIFILAEGFNSIAVNKDLTPTLYQLTHDGWNFTNYYSPVFLSTTGGEFQAMTSLIPTQEILGMWRNNNPYLPYSLGNAFGNIGYNARSYHNWSYKYYGRDKTMPSLGFSNYLACGNGLEERMNCDWIPSDIDLFTKTIDDYAKNEPFVTYYITVSGHAPYNFTGGNSIALKNKELVEGLPYSDAVKSYIAGQLELESALTSLIKDLKDKKILDDTVIVLTGDHYPYTLTNDEINEISDYERDEIIEVNHSNLVIWNKKTTKKQIDKVASQIDVLPTILNLFGMEYDSRLLIGNDIFSNTEGFAIFSNRSWVSDKGKYFVNEGFIPNSEEVDQKYIEDKNNRILNSFTMSKLIIEHNLYDKILNHKEN